jgi:transposase
LPPRRERTTEGARRDEAMVYTDTIKARMLRRMVGPAGVSATVLAQETGISQSTLSRWLLQAGKVRGMAEKDGSPEDPAPSGSTRRPQDWTAAEKLRAVVETSELEEEALGEYLRRSGLYREQLDQWRADALEALAAPAAQRRRSAAEGKRIKELERELRRKEKALAETAALLVLRKKLNALWGDGGDDTDEGNEP